MMQTKQSRPALRRYLTQSNIAIIAQKYSQVSQNTEKTPRKIKVSAIELDQFEKGGLSEQQIADKINCSRMGLYKYRLSIDCPQKIRQGKGTSKYTLEDKKVNFNHYQKEYNKRLIDKYGTSTRGRNKKQQQEIVLAVLGRPLKPSECLHHINNDPSNNAHTNLVVCNRAYHRHVFHTLEAQSKISNYKTSQKQNKG